MPDFREEPARQPIQLAPGLHVSAPPDSDGSVNQTCHGATGGVSKQPGNVLVNPLIMPVFWGAEYRVTTGDGASLSDTAEQCFSLISDMCLHGFFSEIAQYGVEDVFLLSPTAINDGVDPPNSITSAQIAAQMASWLANYPPLDKPSDILNQWKQQSALGETAAEVSSLTPNPCYILFLPPNMAVSDRPGAGGYHGWVSFQGDNVPMAVVFSTGTPAGVDGAAYANRVAPLVGHELVEMMTDPLLNAWFNLGNGCEIGDICECKAANATCADGLNTVPYIGKWNLEAYWSNQLNACWYPPTTPLPQPVAVNPLPETAGPGGGASIAGATTIGGNGKKVFYKMKGPL